MKMINKRWKQAMKREKGSSLIEIVVALALLGAIGVSFLSALATTSTSRAISNEHTAARILAASQIDSIREQSYNLSYDAVPIPDEYEGYTTQIDIASISANDTLQKITVTVNHQGKEITTLETYKAIR